jgi:hypothetical protein
MIDFAGIERRDVADIWPAIEPGIEGACAGSHTGLRAMDIRKALMTGEMNVCVAVDDGRIAAMCVSEVVNRPLHRIWRVMILTGSQYERWIPFVKHVEETARGLDCRYAESIARPGWERVMKPFGWKRTHVLLVKELTDA